MKGRIIARSIIIPVVAVESVSWGKGVAGGNDGASEADTMLVPVQKF